jgi:hypothetical protein
MNRLRRTLVVFLLAGMSLAQSGTGSVCVASRADDPFRGQVIPPSGQVESHGLRVRIDKGTVTPWPQRKSLKIDDLDLAERHLLSVIDARGKPVESFWFRFSEFRSNQLCMSYDEYQGVQLKEDTRYTPWCKCKEQSK